MKATRNYNDIDWKEIFYYDETSPSCLRWKVNVLTGRHKNIVIVPVHSTAGSLSSDSSDSHSKRKY